jgi:HAD superfamily hydrolase (TIGR01509 family)
MDFDLLIFDCDGTLVDSEYVNNLATIQILHEHGLTQYTMEYAFAHFVGMRTSTIVQQIEAETGYRFPADLNYALVKRVEELSPQYLKKIPHAFEVVQTALQYVRTCVASNGYRDTVISSLVRTDLKPFFPDEHIFTAVQVAQGKPAPDLFLFAAEKMGVPPERCVVIEDSIPGVTAGAAAGMRVLGYCNDQHLAGGYADRLKKAGAEDVFSSLIHIQNQLFS